MGNKRKLKGFTLIELMIVLAIFAVILSLVMSFVDPVSKLMKTTSTRERTAAYVDNISEYIDNSLHYARFIRIYNGDFCDEEETARLSEDIYEAEKKTAELLVKDMLNDAVDENCQPIKGQVRVLKLINTPVDMNGNSATNDAVDLKEGQIYESVYKFTAGSYITEKIEKIENPRDAIIDVISVNSPVINDEHMEEYNYYYKKGYFTLDPIIDYDNYSDSIGTSFAKAKRAYFSRLNSISDHYTTMGESLCINVVSYIKGNKVENVSHSVSEGVTEDNLVLFKSPSQINSASMALPNVRKCTEAGEVICIRPDRDASTGKIIEDSFTTSSAGGTNSDTGLPYREFTPAYTGADASYITDNIYIVYIMPEEIFDTTIVYK